MGFILSPSEMYRRQGVKLSFSLAWNIFSTFGMSKHGIRHGISICCSLVPQLPFCLRFLCEPGRPKCSRLWVSITLTAATQSWKSCRKTSRCLLPSYSPCEQQMASLMVVSWYRAHPARQLLLPSSPRSLHKSCPFPNPALSHLSWVFGAIHRCRELPGKLNLPVTLLLWGKRFSPFFSQCNASDSLNLVKSLPMVKVRL